MSKRLRIALPNKGRLAQDARDLLGRAGLEFDFRGERALQADLGADFKALFVRAADIPEFVAEGAADFGITGLDLIRESGRSVDQLLDLGFGRCRLAVAVRDESAVVSVDQLRDNVRVATAFPRLTNEFLQGRGCQATLVHVNGATEVTPLLGVADVVVDLVATGSTLRVNGLREIATIMSSSAYLIARPGLKEEAVAGAKALQLTGSLESVLRAQEKRYLMTNVPRGRIAELKRILPGLNGPTIVDVLAGTAAEDLVAAHAVVDRVELERVISELRGIGAVGILVTRIERLLP